MSRMATFQCDGPACLEMLEDVEDEDDVMAQGWFVVTFLGEGDDERVAHLHSAECVISWAREEADA